MSTARAIFRSYRAPRVVMRDHFTRGASEQTALGWVFIACLLFFFAQLPRISRQVHFEPNGPGFDALAGGAFLGTVLMAPLVFYGVAAVSRMVSKLFGGQGSWLSARLALFWALLAAAPFVLLQGLVAGFIGPSIQLSITAMLSFGVFLYVWVNSLIVAERGPSHDE